MSDTVLIALITFASGAVGSIIGYFTARHSERMSLVKDARRTTYEHRVSAYSACVDAFLNTGNERLSHESLSRMKKAFATATILAPRRTSNILSELHELIVRGELDMEHLHALEADMLDAMRADLDEFESKPLTRRKFRKEKPQEPQEEIQWERIRRVR